MTQTIYIVAGPTASGKSARALELAQKYNGVIINCDSIQVYDAFPILSARPSEEELTLAPHKLYGEFHPNEICSAGNWREFVEPLIEQALDNGQLPIICGGTGLYINTLLEGLSPIPDIPDDIRAQAIQRQLEWPAQELHALLQEKDPVMAQKLDPMNKARMVRALEVIESTGKSLSEWQKLDKLAPPSHWTFKIEVIMPDRGVLYERCNQRFVNMVDNGALDEVQDFAHKIIEGSIKPGTPSTKTMGFKHLLRYLARNNDALLGVLQNLSLEKDDLEPLELDQAISLAQTQTRQYAKRQISWFNNQLRHEHNIL